MCPGRFIILYNSTLILCGNMSLPEKMGEAHLHLCYATKANKTKREEE